jgi:hypothetical protein
MNKMIKTIKHIIRGCGYLPTCGEHPGTGTLIIFILMGAFATAPNGGWKGAIFGASAMTIFVAPLYLYGAYERSALEEKNSKKS